MKRDSSVTVDNDSQRVDGHTFLDGYETHDVAEAQVVSWADGMGFEIENWGIDMRHQQDVLGDDKMDLRFHTEAHDNASDETWPVDNLVAQVDIKSKTNPDWFGITNRSHFRKYLAHAHATDVPTAIYMSLLDDEAVTRECYIPIEQWDEYNDVLADVFDYYPASEAERFLVEQIDKHPQIERTFRAPDGNQVVALDTDDGMSRTEFFDWVAGHDSGAW